MDHETVKTLEGEMEQIVAEVIVRMDLKRLPLLSSRRTLHLEGTRSRAEGDKSTV
jgi:hypothetical protein